MQPQLQPNELEQTFTMRELLEAFEYAKDEWKKEVSVILNKDKN